MNYRTLMWGATAFSVACWAVVTGLTIEKVVNDGVQSWTLLLAMPVFVAAVGLLLHLAVEDFREWRIIRPFIALGLAGITFAVTLPNSIGSAGSAKDVAVAEATASNRNLAFSEGMLIAARNDLDDAKKNVRRECLGAPEPLTPIWKNCSWWRRQVDAHTLAVEKYGKDFSSAPVEKQALSGETRIAWAGQKFGFSFTEADVQMAQPMTPPIAGELLCAFFSFMALEFRKKSLKEAADAAKAKAESETKPEAPAVEAPAPAPVPPVAEPEQAGEEIATLDPVPPTGGKRPTRQQRKKAKVFDFGRAYNARHGHWPSHGQIAGRFHLAGSTASVWRSEMIKAAA